jgi:chromosomal replication initiation ATPase DnaA
MENINKDIQKVVSSLSKALKKHTAVEIIAAFNNINKPIKAKQINFDFLIEKTCSVLELPNKKLLYSKARGEVFEAKKCLFYLLKYHEGWPPRKIAKEFGSTDAAVFHAIKKVNEMDLDRNPFDKKLRAKMDEVLNSYNKFIEKSK